MKNKKIKLVRYSWDRFIELKNGWLLHLYYDFKLVDEDGNPVTVKGNEEHCYESFENYGTAEDIDNDLKLIKLIIDDFGIPQIGSMVSDNYYRIREIQYHENKRIHIYLWDGCSSLNDDEFKANRHE